MGRLIVEKLSVNIKNELNNIPRKYTLTHSDRTGDLYLTVASDYNKKQISGLYTRFMRDEVLAEWENSSENPVLHVYCHISGGITFGDMDMRESIFRREMGLVLEAIRFGDRKFFEKNPKFDEGSIVVHFQKSGKDYKIERIGKPIEYSLKATE